MQSRTYPIFTPKIIRKGRPRYRYPKDSYLAMGQVLPYKNRVIDDGGTFEAEACLNFALYQLEYLK